MACSELHQLRESVRLLKGELAVKRRLAAQRAHVPRTERRSSNEFEWFLERRIARVSGDIDRHLSSHPCTSDTF